MLYYILFALCLYIQQVVSVDQSGVMAFWLLDTGQRVKNHSGIHGDAEVTSLAQDSSGTMLYTGATDGTIKVRITTCVLQAMYPSMCKYKQNMFL